MRRIVESIISGLILLSLTKALDKYGGIGPIYQTFIVELWFVWIGLLTALLYWFIADYIRLRRFTNMLRQWIGFLSYRDSNGVVLYTDLKGKIKRYIQEELEKLDIPQK